MKQEQIKINGGLIIALSRSMREIHRESEVLFRQNQLTMAQFAVLEALLHKGELTIGALIEAVLSTSGNMTVVVRNLERQGWVRRKEHPMDRRSVLIALTDTGERLITRVFARHMELVEQALTPLTQEEKENVIRTLKKIV